MKSSKAENDLPFYLQGTASSMAFLLTSRFPSCGRHHEHGCSGCIHDPVLCHLLGSLKLLMCFSLSRRDMTWAKPTQPNTAKKAAYISGNALNKIQRCWCVQNRFHLNRNCWSFFCQGSFNSFVSVSCASNSFFQLFSP